MRLLITGGAGFLGSALANRLHRAGHEVLVLDDLSAGERERLDKGIFFHRVSIQDRPRLWTLLQGVEVVYHLAARTSVAESVNYPREYNAINVDGTLALLEAMRDVRTPKLIFTSSGALYGEQAKQPVPEEALPNPRSPYAVSKLAAEHYIHTVGQLWGIETVALRIFNAYGPGQPLPPFHAPVVPRFLHQAVGGGSLVIFGHGRQTRDFVYLDDVVEALATVLKREGLSGMTINIGSGVETSIEALAHLILRLTGSHSNILYSPRESGGISRLCADLRRAQALLGYRPAVSLEEGLRRTLKLDPRFSR